MENEEKLFSLKDLQKTIKEICKWSGSNKGRLIEYQKILDQFHPPKIPSNELLICVADIIDIVEVWEFWRENEDDFPGIKKKVCNVINEGPTIADDENPQISDNKTRNDLFVYLLAGKLITAGIEVISIDGIPNKSNTQMGHGDLIVRWETKEFIIECKRPQKETSIRSNAKGARIQIEKSGKQGLLALDCSKPLRPNESLLDFSDNQAAQNYLLDRMENEITPLVKSQFRQSVLGAFLMISVPGVKKVGQSTILNNKGIPLTEFKPFRVSTILFVSNELGGQRHPLVTLIYKCLQSARGNFGNIERTKKSFLHI